MSPDTPTPDEPAVASEEEPRPHVFQTGTVEDPPDPDAGDDVERPQVFRQGQHHDEAVDVGELPAPDDNEDNTPDA